MCITVCVSLYVFVATHCMCTVCVSLYVFVATHLYVYVSLHSCLLAYVSVYPQRVKNGPLSLSLSLSLSLMYAYMHMHTHTHTHTHLHLTSDRYRASWLTALKLRFFFCSIFFLASEYRLHCSIFCPVFFFALRSRFFLWEVREALEVEREGERGRRRARGRDEGGRRGRR